MQKIPVSKKKLLEGQQVPLGPQQPKKLMVLSEMNIGIGYHRYHP